MTQEVVLTHHGVKGMKWGQRKQRQLDTYTRIASGHGKAHEKLRLSLNAHPIEIARGKGSVKKIAANRASVLEADKARIESGKATLRDKLDRAMNTSVIDLARGQ